MKSIMSFRFILVFFLNLSALRCAAQYNSLVVAVLMIKNEEPNIQATLKPLIESGIESFFIFDTGSTDRTIEITQSYLSTFAHLQTYIIQEPFIDFGSSRNRALDLVEEKFPDATFMLMVDAEWYLESTNQLIPFCIAEQHTIFCAYNIRLIGKDIEFPVARLIRCKTNTRFVGAVHEYLQAAFIGTTPTHIFFNWSPSNYGIEKSKKRWQRDREILEKEYRDKPTDSRTVFYLAQTYYCLEEWEKAAALYKKRTELNGWDQEVFMSWYYYGMSLERITKQESQSLWQEKLNAYLTAYSIIPERIEPLLKIAEHYLEEKNYTLAFFFARHAFNAPYPADGKQLFLDKNAYEYYRYNLLSIISWYVNEYVIGEQATRLALKKYPDLPHLHRNLAFYLNAHFQQTVDSQQ